ncbi:MAG: pseudouridine synthase [Candidatus Humimicrobiaceae bacterium]
MEKIRIARFLAQCSLGSRRKCEVLVQEGKIKVNGSVIKELFFKIDPVSDDVEYSDKKLKIENKAVIALNKPPGILCTVKDDFNRRTVIDLMKDFNIIKGLFPVGRLDLDSRGLLLMTNDGDFAYKVLHPKFNILKTYEVLLKNPLKEDDIKKLKNQPVIDGTMVDIKNIKIFGKNKKITLTIHEGRKRIIRRIFKEMGYAVEDLKRISIGNFEIGDLKEGEFKILNDSDLRKILMSD